MAVTLVSLVLNFHKKNLERINEEGNLASLPDGDQPQTAGGKGFFAIATAPTKF